MALSKEDKQDLVDALHDLLNQRRTIDEERHANDHKFIWTLIQRERANDERKQRRRELIMSAKKTAVGWIVVAILTLVTGIGGRVYDFFGSLIHRIAH